MTGEALEVVCASQGADELAGEGRGALAAHPLLAAAGPPFFRGRRLLLLSVTLLGSFDSGPVVLPRGWRCLGLGLGLGLVDESGLSWMIPGRAIGCGVWGGVVGVVVCAVGRAGGRPVVRRETHLPGMSRWASQARVKRCEGRGCRSRVGRRLGVGGGDAGDGSGQVGWLNGWSGRCGGWTTLRAIHPTLLEVEQAEARVEAG